MEIFKQRVMDFFTTLDKSIEKLSHMDEGDITGLPSWTLTNKHVAIGYTPDHKQYIVKVSPNIPEESNILETIEVNGDEILNRLLSPMDQIEKLSLKKFRTIKEDHFEMFGDFLMLPADGNPLGQAVPVNFLVLFGGKQKLEQWLSPETAKKEAQDYWNARHYPNPTENKNYVLETKRVLEKLSAIIKRKSWVERKIHRYINTHAHLLLPSHKNKFFEHPLTADGEQRDADFILEREEGFPPLLIELESPVHKIFKKSGEPTYMINHANFQIREWDWMIQKNSNDNASGEFEFLLGKRDFLVIAGRRTDNNPKILNKIFGDTTIWSYDDFIEQARNRLNADYVRQCKILGLDEAPPF